jgi:hypothetical protein
MKDGCEASFVINDAVMAKILGLLEGDTFECFLGLRNCDRVFKALQVFCEASLVRALMKPLGQSFRIIRWQIGILRILGKFDYGLRPQNAVQVLVEQDLR